MVMVPAEEVATVIYALPAKLPTCQLEPLAISSWPLVVGAVAIPVPPLVMDKVPEVNWLVLMAMSWLEAAVSLPLLSTVKLVVEAAPP